MANLDLTIRRGYESHYDYVRLNRSFISTRLDEERSTPGWSGPGRGDYSNTDSQEFHFYAPSELNNVKLAFTLTVSPGAYFREEEFVNSIRQYWSNITNITYRDISDRYGGMYGNGYVNESEDPLGRPIEGTAWEIEIDFDMTLPKGYTNEIQEGQLVNAPRNSDLSYIRDSSQKVDIQLDQASNTKTIHGETVKFRVTPRNPSEELYNIELSRSHFDRNNNKHSPYRFMPRSFILPLKKLSDGLYEAEFKVSNPVMHEGDSFSYSIAVNKKKDIVLKRENASTSAFVYKIDGRAESVNIPERGVTVGLIVGATMTTEKIANNPRYYRLTKYKKGGSRDGTVIFDKNNIRGTGQLDSLKITDDIEEIYTAIYQPTSPILAVKYTERTSAENKRKFKEEVLPSSIQREYNTAYVDQNLYDVYIPKVSNRNSVILPFKQLTDFRIEDVSYMEPYTKGSEVNVDDTKASVGKVDNYTFIYTPKLDLLARPVIYLTYDISSRYITNTNPETKQSVIQSLNKRYSSPLRILFGEDIPQSLANTDIFFKKPLRGGEGSVGGRGPGDGDDEFSPDF